MHTHRSKQPRIPQAGFTFIETLVATSIFLVVLFGVYAVYDASERNYATGTRKWDVQSQARVGLERLGREIRAAGYAFPTKVADPVVIATNDTFSFHADLDGTGPKYVTYSLRDCNGNVGSVLYRNVSTTTFCGGDPFLDGVTNLAFSYYELNNVPLPYPPSSPFQLDNQAPLTGADVPSVPAVGGQRDHVRQVKIVLTVQQQARNILIPFTATTDVTLRNLIP